MRSERVILFVKPGCHLCEDMHDQLRRALRGTGVAVAERNIAANLDDFKRYTQHIPVLTIDGREVARYRITDDDLDLALRQACLIGSHADDRSGRR